MHPERVSHGQEALHLIVAPSHRDSIQNMTTGALQANTAHIMVPADGSFTTAIAKDNHKAGEIQRWTRQHSKSIDLLGVQQICTGANKMDCGTADYKQIRATASCDSQANSTRCRDSRQCHPRASPRRKMLVSLQRRSIAHQKARTRWTAALQAASRTVAMGPRTE